MTYCLVPNHVIMNDCMNEKTDKWLLKVKQWQTDDSTLSVIKDQTLNIPDILSFLSELIQALKTFTSVADALHNIPQVGQLLGMFILSPRLLLNTDIFRALMTCIMFFYVDKPSCSVEDRAKLWVISQIKQMICNPNDDLHNNLTTIFTGHKLRDFHTQCVDKVCKEFTSSVDKSHTKSMDVSILCDICYVCLSLRDVAAFDKLFTSVLQQLVINSPSDDRVFKLVKDIEQTQKHPYTANHPIIPVCHDGQILLWSHSLYMLEHEVLDLIEKAISACATQPHIYAIVFSILRDVTECNDYHWKFVNLVHMLHRLVRNKIENNHQHSINLIIQYPEPIRHLVGLLCFRPKDLSTASLENHIQQIDECLTVECHHLRSWIQREIHFTIIQFLEWYITVMSYSYICDKKLFSCCLRILTVLNGYSENIGVVNQVTQDVIECLRCLFSKHHLSNVDLCCALDSVLAKETSQLLQNKVIADRLLAKMLLLFCVLSFGGHLVLTDILSIVFGKDSSEHYQLETLLMTVTHIQDSGLSLLKINEDVRCWLISAVNRHSQSTCDTLDNCDLSIQIQLLTEQ
ncbi:hypothetical protein LSH36_218g02004 [Paralvinella palmiformis]|uniref:Uncharacterized protein n=1 Tax=Paralvinella palmiformis TaxID=53620 RepID=A0AAD9N5J2_9ANNE|nr:hypothetical protein LSH36_218g02004 [Paralvinella palmiformis]